MTTPQILKQVEKLHSSIIIDLIGEILTMLTDEERQRALANWCSACGGSAPCWCNIVTPCD